ncbi:DUF998 domain-containing protein [Amycolatopsis regifaucium]|uniref:DUF998 domain-containing protein n=1 Tax=Amycolatopsis regifaucium TaxID=546365 RepID=A0A154MHA1_9PSEU|nr:DUF998 domain-containing protein [Amycolatopsis regifaucium]KZB83792.1 hypothetical protein AVL48_34920 [Amycolatopsis regifaucium]OKA06767.1 hypothetical protein ATP06_0219700 [Amycolatopsis regifaucium]SFH26340.1 Protein of unknown function [Amycolatopsis regifaucium]
MTIAVTRTALAIPTRALLACGAVSGPLYFVTALTQAAVRDGFDLTKHPASMLSNGDAGWIQVTNFLVTGVLMLAGAAGLRRALEPGRGSVWGPRLLGVFGASLLFAAVFKADPGNGFPVGTGPATISTAGILHMAAGSVGFLSLIVATFVFASRFSREGHRGWAVYSRATGIAFFATFAGISSGNANAVVMLAFWAAVLLAWGWVTAVILRTTR